MKTYQIFLLICLSGFFSGCNSSSTKERKQPSAKSMEETLIQANRQAMRVEDQQIEQFIERYKWEMTETGSGLRYAIYHQGNGEKASPGKIAVLNYRVLLITGDEIYNSAIDGRKEFMIGKGGVESGLEEGILLLRVGDKAKFIIPSHLGFGLLGDQNLVPPKSTLIYDLELIALN